MNTCQKLNPREWTNKPTILHRAVQAYFYHTGFNPERKIQEISARYVVAPGLLRKMVSRCVEYAAQGD